MLFSLTACAKTAEERDVVRTDETYVQTEINTREDEPEQAETGAEKSEIEQKTESGKKKSGSEKELLKEISEDDLTAEERNFFESFLNFYYEDSDNYVYTYAEMDNKPAVCIFRSDIENVEGNIYIKENTKILDWLNHQKDDILSKNAGDWKNLKPLSDIEKSEEQEWIFAYVSQNEYGETNFWYREEADFLKDFGFKESEPFYQCNADYAVDAEKNLKETHQLILYYDKETKTGAGILREQSYDLTECFTFDKSRISEKAWEGFLTDYSKQETCWGESPEQYGDDEEYQYDSHGRVIHYECTSEPCWLAEKDENERKVVLKMDYDYEKNGKLKRRYYYHDSMLLGSTRCSMCSYFDDRGRLEFEKSYITHGYMFEYYIYTDNSDKPTYYLYLDNMGTSLMPEFIIYAD